MAESYYAQIAPHLYNGPVGAAASIQLATATPNFLIQESILTWDGFHSEILKKPIQWQDGFIIPPTQLCTAVERVYVHAAIYDEFVQLLKSNFESKKIGDRSVNPEYMGPLVNESSRISIHQMVQRAVDDGASLLVGGEIPAGKGYFYPPTLLINCRQDMEIVQEEIFGPVLCVLKYESIDQALEMANDHQFGLSSVLYTENYRTALFMANNIEAGELYINKTPADAYQGYHSGWKRSGLGGDDGKHGMLEFTQTRLVTMKF